MTKPQVFYDADGATGTGDGSQHQGNTFSQDDVNNIVAKATKGLKADFATMQSSLEAITAERDKFVTKNKEREESEMTELDKVKTERDEFKSKFETTITEVDKFKADQKERDEAEEKKVEKQMEGLTDSQKSIVEALDLYKRLDAIAEFKQIKSSSGMQGGGHGNGSGTPEMDLSKRLNAAKSPRERDQIIREATASIKG